MLAHAYAGAPRRRSYITRPGYRSGMAPLNKGIKLPPEPLTRHEVDALLAACGRGPAGVRNRALIVVLWRAGLRLDESLSLLPKDVDLDVGSITVLHGKGDRRRVVGIDPQACAVIRDWIERRRELGLSRGAPLFCTFSAGHAGQPAGRKLWPSYVRDLLKRLAARAGIEKRVHPHGLRHTHATELAREGAPIHYIRKQLGHSSLAITERYIDHLTPGEVLDWMRRREWGAPAGHGSASASGSTPAASAA